jgi:iron only hydrogenase large subunit-like protein
MSDYFHSVTLDYEKCLGCTNCIKRCPVEAIRVHEGKAKIMQERCIDCGECIRACPNHAKIAVTDTLDRLPYFKYKIALPAPSFFGQFNEEAKVEDILEAFLHVGFDDVFEVALAAEIVTHIVHKYLDRAKNQKKPLFSSACPAVLRLMQIKFPDLLDQVLPIMTPMEVAACRAKDEAVRKTGLSREEIGAFFISPCPAKVTEMKRPITGKPSSVDGVIGISVLYKDILKQVQKKKTDDRGASLRRAGNVGMAWGYVTGESKGIDFGTSLAVSGIHNVISLLEEIEHGELKDVDFIELQSCIGGCVGGPLNIQNLFVGRVRLRHLVKKYPIATPYYDEEHLAGVYESGDFELTDPIKPTPIMVLDEDMSRALIKMERLDAITKELPGLDCGACGSPSCRALAEDIVRGLAFDTDCIINLRGRVKTLAEEILDLARKLPPAMSNSSRKDAAREQAGEDTSEQQ